MAESKSRLAPGIMRRLEKLGGAPRMAALYVELTNYRQRIKDLPKQAESIGDNWRAGQNRTYEAAIAELEQIIDAKGVLPWLDDSPQQELSVNMGEPERSQRSLGT